MILFRFILTFCLLTVFIFSCKTVEDNFDTDLGHDYLRLEVGKFIEYEVDSTIYDPTGDSTVFSTRSYLRDVIVDTLLNNVGDILYRTERSFRRDTLDNWQIQKVFTQSIEGNQGIQTIDNLRLIKLAFPIQEFNSWNPIVHIDPNTQIIVAGETLRPFLQDGIWRARILEAEIPDTVGNFSFDETITLREVNTTSYSFEEIQLNPDSLRTIEDDSPIELRVSHEKYAKGVGLVYRERWILDTDKCQQECNPLEINYLNCYDPCFNSCLANGSDSLSCETNCNFVDCVNQYSNFNDCRNFCEALPWVDKATKGFIMRMRAIRFN
ncbi:MAG: hypothetical protein AAFZ15_04655 [Bacteroidota bacterium]